MIMHQKPSDRPIFCQLMSQVQSVSNMNFRMDGSAGPSASMPDWSLAGSVVLLTDDWRGGLWRVDFVAFPGLGLGLHLDLGAFRLSVYLGLATSAERLRIMWPRWLS
jgi:hypothetical protein